MLSNDKIINKTQTREKMRKEQKKTHTDWTAHYDTVDDDGSDYDEVNLAKLK